MNLTIQSARQYLVTLCCAASIAMLGTGCAPQVRVVKGGGIDVGEQSSLTSLVPAAELEHASHLQYDQMLEQAGKKKILVKGKDPRLLRLNRIAKRIIPFSARINPRARAWKWEVNLFKSKQLNAFCMPGGKIAFYTGIIDRLKLTDNEIAIIMGHEIAHALREHARSRIAKSRLTEIGTSVGGAVLGALTGNAQAANMVQTGAQIGGKLLTLRFSRNDESEADVVGLDLAARAGYDPRAGVTLWRKMTAASKGAPPTWLSTHPAGKNRIAEIEKYLPAVMPLYHKAKTKQRHRK